MYGWMDLNNFAFIGNIDGTRFVDDCRESIRRCQQYVLLAALLNLQRHSKEQALDRAVDILEIVVNTWPYLFVVQTSWKMKGSVRDRRPA